MCLIQLTKDILTICATCVGLWVAIEGLNAWKKQLKGKTDYELARRYLKAVYKIREAIKDVRHPLITIGEITQALKEAGEDVTDNLTGNKPNRAVYSLRWKKVNEAVTDLDLELLEAEVSWGNEARDVQKGFDMCRRKLYASLKLFLEGQYLEGQRDIIYDSGEEDAFNIEMNVEIRKIETYLRPHLK